MAKNTFFLGLGNQKCGTSWLHKYLQAAENFDGGKLKEYHIWDALDVPMLREHRVRKKHNIMNPVGRLRANMQTQDDAYFDYFTSLYTNQVHLSADITPSYSALGAARLNYIKNKFGERNVAVKAIILIRDPLERIKSAVRFNLDRENYREGIEVGTKEFRLAMEQYYTTEHCKLRTQYQRSISVAYEVFGAENVYVGIYENMFESAEIERLSAFCGVALQTQLGQVRINPTRGKAETIPALENQIRQAYDAVYQYCYDAFPLTKSLWN